MITVLDLPDEAATTALAVRMAALCECGDIIALIGDLGAGKTTFARSFIRACGAGGGDDEVPSPTFTLVQTYEGATATVWHFDLYRLIAADEAWELGIEDAFASGISLIEWPDRLGPLLPRRRLEIAFEFTDSPGSRRALIAGDAAWRKRLAEITAHA